MRLSRREVLALGAGGVLAAGFQGPALAQDAPLKIGVLMPLSGAAASFGDRFQGMIVALAKQINAAGGIGGRQIALTIEDDQTNPNAGVQAAQKLVNIDGVEAVIGSFTSAVSLAVIPVLAQKGIPMLTVATSPEMTRPDQPIPVFRFSPSDAVGGAVLAVAAQKKGFSRAAMLLRNDPYGLGLGESFKAYFTSIGGEITDSVVFDVDRASYRSELATVFANKPDAILFGGFTPDAIELVRQSYQLGQVGTWLGQGFAFNDEFRQAVGDDAASTCFAVDPTVAGGSVAFVEADRLWREVAGKPADLYVALAYDQLMVLALCVARYRDKTFGAGFADNLRSVTNPPGDKVGTWAAAQSLLGSGGDINYEGASGSCDFDEHGNTLPAHVVFSAVKGPEDPEFLIQPVELKGF